MDKSKMLAARCRIQSDKIRQIDTSKVLRNVATEIEHLNAVLSEYQQYVSPESKLIEMLARYQS
jgi:hypothetical protein